MSRPRKCITDALYGALGVMAAAQGTMNNFTFGNDRHQYYETICGGSGAGPGFRRHRRGPDPHDQFAPDRSRGAGMALPGAGRRASPSGAAAAGEGKHRGGDGVVRRIRFREPMTAAILSGHRRVPPFGLAGGEPGALGPQLRVERTDGRRRDSERHRQGRDEAPATSSSSRRRAAADSGRRSDNWSAPPALYWHNSLCRHSRESGNPGQLVRYLV